MKGKGKSKYMGVDVSKDRLDWQVSNTTKSYRVKNNQSGCDRIVEQCRKQGVALVVFESTGGYEKLLADTLYAAKIPYSKISPLRGRRFARKR